MTRLYELTGAVADAIAYLQTVSPAWVSDAQASTGVMAPEINPVWRGARLVGPAYTARCYPGSIITVHKALLEAPRGAVLIVDGGGDTTGAMFGELMATEAKSHGLAGVVVDGAVRDVEGLAELQFPAFARAVTPRVGTNRRVGTTQVDIACGGVVVHPGDVVVGAADGVAVITRSALAEVVEAVRAVGKKETDIRSRMARGERVADIIGMRSLIYPQ
ncbi:MAG: RraA family protein [Armatimonadota bacterium]